MAKVTAKDRKKSGFKDDESYPVETEAQCVSAVKLRHNGKNHTAAAVLAKCSRAANAHNWTRCKAAIEKAREVDRS